MPRNDRGRGPRYRSRADDYLAKPFQTKELPEKLRQQLGQRGIRLDQKTYGYGLGLAIVQDIADAYHASPGFSESSLGGLAVRIGFAPMTGDIKA